MGISSYNKKGVADFELFCINADTSRIIATSKHCQLNLVCQKCVFKKKCAYKAKDTLKVCRVGAGGGT